MTAWGYLHCRITRWEKIAVAASQNNVYVVRWFWIKSDVFDLSEGEIELDGVAVVSRVLQRAYNGGLPVRILAAAPTDAVR